MVHTLLNNLRCGWHPVRIIYLVISLAILGEAWHAADVTIALVGALFLFQSLFNTGCCGMNRMRG